MNDPFKCDECRCFPEDYEQENGNYVNKCIYCENFFKGNKHRVSCKKCDAGSIEFWTALSKKQKPNDNKHAHAGCWAEGEMVGFAKCMVERYFPAQQQRDEFAVKYGQWLHEVGAAATQFTLDQYKATLNERTTEN